MNTRALLGFYTLVAIGALLGLFAVLSDFHTKISGYRFGIRFPQAAGLHPGALVYESGVVVGTVDEVSVLPDYSTEVIIALGAHVRIPRNAGFLILQPLQGDPTLRINSPQTTAEAPVPPYPREILPINRQPYGQATVSLAEFLASSQMQFSQLSDLLNQFQQNGPRLFARLDRTLTHADELMMTANSSLQILTGQTQHTLNAFDRSSTELTAQLSQSLAQASSEMLDVTARLDASTRRGQPHIDHMFAELDQASRSLSASVDSLHAIASDPDLHKNVLRSSRSLAETAATFAALLGDVRKITGNEQTQKELSDAVSHIDAASQRASSFMGRFGRSHVAGVDYPAPASTEAPDDGGGGHDGANLPAAGANVPKSLAVPPASAAATAAESFAAQQPGRLIGISLRESELAPARLSPSGVPLTSPLLTTDRGPQTDINATLFPDARTSYLLGANDIGAVTTLNAAEVTHQGPFMYGGGILYSRLGVLGGITAGPFGLETRVYDPRRGSVDLYGNISPTKSTTIFAGERDLTRQTRRPVYGIDLHF